ncbi:hypothetical protein [Arthrobacter sp. Marseille-P9274]|uniref:hypothetical protein n=1 Tax=Arthrobacter sp. Marseille-P9274 TaxID=2866572 RepID=UPI0021C8B493|nr:hypothetical protein [Arthrobacter sp. Marseille-P9274]
MRFSYPQWVQFQGRSLGIVCQNDNGTEEANEDTDGVLVTNGRIVSVRTPEEFSTVAIDHGLDLEDDELESQNLDGLEELLELPMSDDICAQLLNAWNLFADIARSVDATLDDRGPVASKCYDKLFFGNNLESVTPAGEHYSPSFNESERRTMQEILDRGRTILATHL